VIVPDVNLLVPAWNRLDPLHERGRAWLVERVADEEPLGVSELAVSGALRVLTMPGVRRLSHDQGAVLELVDELLAAPGVVRLRAGVRHWGIFRELCRTTGATGNQVPNCHHAALAVEHGATWASRDRFFADVPGLTWTSPY
jgi:toxin-antitoxin system PIN domain toxin